MNQSLMCHYCHEQAVIEIDSGCKCTACGQTWTSIQTFIRERFYHQSRSDDPAKVLSASNSHSNSERFSEQWTEAIAELPVKFSTMLLTKI